MMDGAGVRSKLSHLPRHQCGPQANNSFETEMVNIERPFISILEYAGQQQQNARGEAGGRGVRGVQGRRHGGAPREAAISTPQAGAHVRAGPGQPREASAASSSSRAVTSRQAAVGAPPAPYAASECRPCRPRGAASRRAAIQDAASRSAAAPARDSDRSAPVSRLCVAAARSVARVTRDEAGHARLARPRSVPSTPLLRPNRLPIICGRPRTRGCCQADPISDVRPPTSPTPTTVY